MMGIDEGKEGVGRSGADAPSGCQPSASAAPLRSASSQSGIPNAFGIPEGARFEYRFSVSREGRERHDWCLIADAGGINIWAEPTASPVFAERWFGGVEVHLAAPAEYQDASAPSQALCWLILKPCWHDGSSLYFSEQVEPYLPRPAGVSLGMREHRDVIDHLRSWFRSHVAQAIEARRAATGTGAVEDESAVPQGCAQDNPGPHPNGGRR